MEIEKLEGLIFKDDVVTIEQLIIKNRELIETCYIKSRPCFIYAIDAYADKVINLFIEYKINPNVCDVNNRSLISCLVGHYCSNTKLMNKFLIAYPNVKFNNVINDHAFELIINNNTEFLLSHVNFITEVKLKYGSAINYLCSMTNDEIACKRILIKFHSEIKQITTKRYTRNMYKLISEYLNDNDIINVWSVETGEPISHLFTLVTLLTDNYLEII